MTAQSILFYAMSCPLLPSHTARGSITKSPIVVPVRAVRPHPCPQGKRTVSLRFGGSTFVDATAAAVDPCQKKARLEPNQALTG